jgi:hypothetical protein
MYKNCNPALEMRLNELFKVDYLKVFLKLKNMY